MEFNKFAETYFKNYKPSKFDKQLMSMIEKGEKVELVHKPRFFSKWNPTNPTD